MAYKALLHWALPHSLASSLISLLPLFFTSLNMPVPTSGPHSLPFLLLEPSPHCSWPGCCSLPFRPQLKYHLHRETSTQHRSLSCPASWPSPGLLVAHFTIPHYRVICFLVYYYSSPEYYIDHLASFGSSCILVPRNAPNIVSDTKTTSTHVRWASGWIIHYLFIYPLFIHSSETKDCWKSKLWKGTIRSGSNYRTWILEPDGLSSNPASAIY